MAATLDPMAPPEGVVDHDPAIDGTAVRERTGVEPSVAVAPDALTPIDAPTPSHAPHLHAPHLHAPHLHVGHQPPPQGGSVVAALAVYEVVAVTVNGALDEDVLPSLAGVLRRLRWSSVFGKVAAASALAGMWAVVAGGVVVVAGLNRSRRR